MGKANKYNGTPRTQRDQRSSRSKKTSDLFKLQNQSSQNHRGQTLCSHSSSLPVSDISQYSSIIRRHNKSLPLTLHAITSIASDIKSTLSAAITDLTADLQTMSTKLEGVTKAGKQRGKAIAVLQNTSLIHQNQIYKKLEDIHNRGRRHNIRDRGVPRAIPPES